VFQRTCRRFRAVGRGRNNGWEEFHCRPSVPVLACRQPGSRCSWLRRNRPAPGDIVCLLSPACASLGHVSAISERGDVFTAGRRGRLRGHDRTLTIMQSAAPLALASACFGQDIAAAGSRAHVSAGGAGLVMCHRLLWKVACWPTGQSLFYIDSASVGFTCLSALGPLDLRTLGTYPACGKQFGLPLVVPGRYLPLLMRVLIPVSAVRLTAAGVWIAVLAPSTCSPLNGGTNCSPFVSLAGYLVTVRRSEREPCGGFVSNPYGAFRCWAACIVEPHFRRHCSVLMGAAIGHCLFLGGVGLVPLSLRYLAPWRRPGGLLISSVCVSLSGV